MASRVLLILCVPSLFFFLAASTKEYPGQPKIFDVRNYGARADSQRDNAFAFTKAWNEACQWSYGRSTVYIPSGIFYLRQVTFSGPCKSSITFFIRGTLLAPRNPYAINQEEWILFKYVDNLTVTGGGLLDGQGSYSWPLNDCNKNTNCRTLAMNIGFAFVKSSKINGLRSINSKMGHFNLFSVEDFNITGVTITAPGDSPNTDGIKIGKSSHMQIYNVTIGTGDDCIAILDGTSNLDISDVRCGPGHGISVGSLGRYKEEKNVQGLTVRNSIINGTTDGLRIKTWAKSVSQISVSNFLYENIQMINVGNPIVIDQQYCPHGQCDSPGKYASHVQIKDVKYNNIWGTSTSKEALKMQCSKTFPCQDVELSNINLHYVGRDGLVTALCENVGGSIRGKIVPANCRINLFLPSNIITDSNSTLEDKMQGIFQLANTTQTQRFHQLPLWILWRLWNSRNILYFQRRHVPWETTLQLAQMDLQEWNEAVTPSHINSHGTTIRSHIPNWRRPTNGWVKCNVDGSFINGNIPGKGGWIVRDHNGRYEFAGQAIGNCIDNALECEFQALLMAMQHCWSKGYRRICFEGDNKEMFDLINGLKMHFGAFNWIRDILWWASKFEQTQFQWTNRQNNKPADILARTPLQHQFLFANHFWVPRVISFALHCDYTSSI